MNYTGSYAHRDRNPKTNENLHDQSHKMMNHLRGDMGAGMNVAAFGRNSVMTANALGKDDHRSP